MMSMRQPTGSDVARLAGVSKSAVSRVYTGGVVSEDARTKILAAARLLKYRPNRTARSLTTSESKLIGVAITHLDNQFYPEVLELLSDRLAVAGFRIVLFITHGEADLDPVLDELLGYRLDGVVLASSSMASRVASECLDANVPVVMFNNVDPEGRAPGITADGATGAREIARFLIAGEHRRFAVISGIAESTTSVERSRAFAEAVIAAGMQPPQVGYGEYSFTAAQQATRALLSAPEPPDAIFCVNDHMALAALQAARELGYEPGRNISIVGFDNVPIASWPAFNLTTYAQPIEEMIDATVEHLVAAIDGDIRSLDTMRMAGKLIVRASARVPKAAFA